MHQVLLLLTPEPEVVQMWIAFCLNYQSSLERQSSIKYIQHILVTSNEWKVLQKLECNYMINLFTTVEIFLNSLGDMAISATEITEVVFLNPLDSFEKLSLGSHNIYIQFDFPQLRNPQIIVIIVYNSIKGLLRFITIGMECFYGHVIKPRK